MADNVTKKKRSEIMSKIKSQDSIMEIAFRKALWNEGFRYRKNAKNYYGKPDIVLPKHMTVIFIDSCFWHGCKKHCRLPSSRKSYWQPKIQRNVKRDKQVNAYYRKEKWNIVRIWEHQLKKNEKYYLEKVKNFILEK